MTDTQKALDLIIRRHNDLPLTLQEFEVLEQVKAALEAKAVPDNCIHQMDVDVLEQIKNRTIGGNKMVMYDPDTHVLVPIEPTREMIKAAWFMQYLHHGGDADMCEELSEKRVSDKRQFISDVLAYKAMIKAAQGGVK